MSVGPWEVGSRRVGAGVDIGNATTEIVIADLGVSPPRPLLWDRRPTRGIKGSLSAAQAAAHLLRLMERRAGLVCAEVLLTPQAPAHTRLVGVARPALALGRLSILHTGAPTPAGVGVGVGRPVLVSADPGSVGPQDDVVLVVEDPLGFRDTARRIRAWLEAGRAVRAVVLAGDEARLVSARIGAPSLPVLDGVDPAVALSAERLVVEIAAPGHAVRHLVDPIWLGSVLGLAPDEHVTARAVAAELSGTSCAVVARMDTGRETPPRPSAGPRIGLRDGTEFDWEPGLVELRRRPAGSTSYFVLPPEEPVAATDLWWVDLDQPHTLPRLRPGPVQRRHVTVSSMSPESSAAAWIDPFADDGLRRVTVLGSEPAAARTGALTTPGAREDAVVLDLGGGTMDLIGAQSVTAAGSGDLLTASVAHVLDLSEGAAEWVKRGPSERVEEPLVVSDESGGRRFLDAPSPPGTVGWLTVPGPGGPLPFATTLAAPEWRLVRQALKRAVFADNLHRISAGDLDLSGLDVLLVGGPAADEEILDVLRDAVPGAVFGRANVAGCLGTRWAVAYGLLLAAAEH